MAEEAFCYHIYFSGHVQGVGFRWQARQLATGFGLGGWIRNLPDGRVEMLVSGNKKAVEDYLCELRRQLGGCIHEEQQQPQDYDPKLTEFTILY